MKRSVLLIFLRYPVPGQTKTRMHTALSPERAAAFYRCMAEHTVHSLAALAERDIDMVLAVTPPDAVERTNAWLGKEYHCFPQSTGDLGARLSAAFSFAFASGAAKVVAIGTDCPELEAAHVREAFTALDLHKSVLGPATDGGYYLLGLREFRSDIFDAIPWSSPRTAQVTIDRLRAAGLPPRLLAPLTDVDCPEDLARLSPEARDLVSRWLAEP
ncbi:MAG: TIGR04282 family arsenosugar biosynthesis glycosyltransferase [Bdellovibrionales bacterium]|nr:TIGR04282 family arsenosugar biosynthesis glycosyltransferase [Bdellovibrionales bacterium]